jgi:hypothetical protein
MGDIIEFPRTERDWWRSFAAELKKLKQFAGHEDAIDWIIADMEPRWAAIGAIASFKAPADNLEANRLAREIVNFCEDMIGRTRTQMFALESELYTAKFGGPPIEPPPDMQVTFEVPKPPKG